MESNRSSPAFEDCPLDSVYIGGLYCYCIYGDFIHSPFHNNTSLRTVVLGNSVTSIGKYEFYGCTGLTSIEIPNSVKSIGIAAFYNCRSLTSIIFPDCLKSIGSNAFEKCISLTSVTSLNPQAPNMVNSFDERTYTTAQLNIPIGAKDSYWLNYDWYKFNNIKEIDTSGINQVETNSGTTNGKAVIYTLDGRRVETEVQNLPAGIYIINGKKVMVE